MNQRLDNLKKILSTKNLDALLIHSYEAYRYFSGFSGSNCYLIIGENDRILITDGRYTEQAKAEAPDFTLVAEPRPMRELICETIKSKGFLKIGYDSIKMTDFELTNLKENTPDTIWQAVPHLGCDARVCKDMGELSKIRKAVEIADEALAELIPHIKPGMCEFEVSALLEYYMARRGSKHPAFETIVASGVRGALPHGAPTDKKLVCGELVTIDFGACFEGYMSDITRTLWLGDIPDNLKDIWNAVEAVQRACVDAVRPGISAKSLDALQREKFADAGLSQYICHSIGHGVGLEIHEAPTVSSSSDAILSPGMVITIEPGLYLPGIGGVRIEDTVLVTENGHEVLTASPHFIKINCND